MTVASRAYSASPVWLQNAALSTYGLVLRSRRYGGIYKRTLEEITASQWLPADQLEALQLERLNATLAVARSVPTYANWNLPTHPLRRLDELRALPTLAKNDLRGPRDRLVSAGAATSLLEIHTGGTTGTPLAIYCDRAVLQRNYAFFERYRQWTGFAPGDRIATFAGRTIVPTGQRGAPFWRFNAAANTMLFSSYHISAATLPAYADALTNFAPHLIDSYPSNLEVISKYLLDKGVTTVRPKAIITSSETLVPAVRRQIEAAFGCRVFDHYGGAEMAALIAQCEFGTYHVNPEFGIVELLRDGAPVPKGESGEIVATGFINHVMPLIRYSTGDLAVWGDGPCSCGRAFPTIARIEGRMDDFLVTPDGFMVGRLDPIFKAGGAILETRLVQDAADHVRIELVPDEGYTSEDGAVVEGELRKRVGPRMRIDVIVVDSIPRTARGKLRMVVNETLRTPGVTTEQVGR